MVLYALCLLLPLVSGLLLPLLQTPKGGVSMADPLLFQVTTLNLMTFQNLNLF
jgi:hypothetical protein